MVTAGTHEDLEAVSIEGALVLIFLPCFADNAQSRSIGSDLLPLLMGECIAQQDFFTAVAYRARLLEFLDQVLGLLLIVRNHDQKQKVCKNDISMGAPKFLAQETHVQADLKPCSDLDHDGHFPGALLFFGRNRF